MTTSTNPIARALDELLRERDYLATRLAKVDAVIVPMRELLADLIEEARAEHAAPEPLEAAPADGLSKTAIRDALRNGPMTPGDLATALHGDKVKVRHLVQELEAQGIVVVTGTTGSRRIALAAPASAKEAP